ncbi:antibiotic biosynthesis monooxygenase family protein [uncultured Arcticibacterium sp.]|uniref:putative quinol monooxygenase n=1 Tax=uncultured Arcticibacterium sp. TaxID=2173042 RepID=UPI0030F59644
MKYLIPALTLLIPSIFISSCSSALKGDFDTSKMMVRIAAIEIKPEFLEEYMAILKVESEASVRLEPGVISIFPMFEKENPNLIKLLEIYETKAAYEAHLKTPHFLEYKTSTLEMVESLELIEMGSIDPETMPALFKKL